MKRFCLSVSLILGVVLGACVRKPAQDGVPIIRIGEVGSFSGPQATFGTSTHAGIQIAIDDANRRGGIRGRKIELITQDDEGKPAEAVLAMNKLITQSQVVAVLGEVASSISLAMAPMAQQFKVPMISPSSLNFHVTQQGDYIFRVCFVDRFQSKVMSDFALNHLKLRKAAVFTDIKSDYSRDSAKIFIEHFKKGGGEILTEQSYASGDLDFKSQLTTIRSLKPDFILLPGYYTDVGLIARQKQELGLAIPLIGGDAWDSPKLFEVGGEAIVGSYFVSHYSQENSESHVQKFVQTYQAQNGVIPDGLAALGHDAAALLIDALQRVPSLQDGPTKGSLLTSKEIASELRETLAVTRGFKGVTGTITLDSDRNALKSAVIFKIAPGGAFKVEAKIEATSLSP